MHLRAYDKTHRPRVRPTMDILDRPDGVLVLVNLPGVAREDLIVEADRKKLSIQGLSRCGRDGQTVLALEFVAAVKGALVRRGALKDHEHRAPIRRPGPCPGRRMATKMDVQMPMAS